MVLKRKPQTICLQCKDIKTKSSKDSKTTEKVDTWPETVNVKLTWYKEPKAMIRTLCNPKKPKGYHQTVQKYTDNSGSGKARGDIYTSSRMMIKPISA